jgi:tetratricopeptide (TPR) repeat protein
MKRSVANQNPSSRITDNMPATAQPTIQVSLCIRNAILQIQQNNYRQALEHLSTALRLQPNYAQAQLLSAQCFHALGEVSQSEAHFLALISTDPNNAFYRHSLAILYNDFDQSKKALEHAEHAVLLAPQQFECWTQLSLAYRKNGKLTHAFDAAEKAVTLSSGHPDALRARAYCNLELNNTKQASDDFQLISAKVD